MSDDLIEAFDYIDRSALVIRPTWKFAEWLQSLETESTLDGQEIFTQRVYLVDEVDAFDATTITTILEIYYLDIVAAECGAWWENEEEWPSIHSLNDFFQYFECVPSESVIDLATEEYFNDDDN